MNRNVFFAAIVFVTLVTLGLVGRLVPHPPNFSPMIATVLFAGFFFRRCTTSLLVVLAVMALSDTVIGTYDVRVMVVVYATLLLPVVLRPYLRRRLTVVRVGGGAVLCSLVFFVTTNLAVWASGSMYPKSMLGLVECYLAALPFLRNALCGDLFWSAVLFGSYVLAVRWSQLGAPVANGVQAIPAVRI